MGSNERYLFTMQNFQSKPKWRLLYDQLVLSLPFFMNDVLEWRFVAARNVFKSGTSLNTVLYTAMCAMHHLSSKLALVEKFKKVLIGGSKSSISYWRILVNVWTNQGFKIKFHLSMVAEFLSLFYRHPNSHSGPHIQGNSITMP